MRARIGGWLVVLATAAPVLASHSSAAGDVVTAKLMADDANGTDWPSYGRTYSENHFSPLDQINAQTLKRLKLAWSLDLDAKQRSDTQPLEANGVVYATAGLTIVYAADAVTGRLLWRYDSGTALVAKQKLRPSWGVRGLALWDTKVIVGTQDGRLLAIDARTGKLLWSTRTINKDDESTITGAPRVFNGRVVIGYAGAERTGIRGSIGCYDAKTGKFLWRFYTVPGNPSKGAENDAMKMAAKTWSGEWWKFGGGGTVWNAMTFDPEMNRLYVGTGNGGPWNWNIRNPKGGDALFLASIVALDANTGRYLWHYQENPNEAWDYNATMDIELATLKIDGQPRKVLMQAPKNGFYYIIDRQTGKLISAAKTTDDVNWATGYDNNTGRPIEAPGIHYETGPKLLWPGTFGVHNWQPMAFDPGRNLAFIPMIHQADIYSNVGVDDANWKPLPNVWNSGMGSTNGATAPLNEFGSALEAWDPVGQRVVWREANPGIVNGGVLSTAGGLVFQGLVDGNFVAHDATTGKRLWSFFGGVSVLGAPISYAVDGRQYVTVMAGPPSGSAVSVMTQQSKFGWRYRDHPRRLLTFTLDGQGVLPRTPPPAPEVPLRDAFVPDPGQVQLGQKVANANCRTCHGRDLIASGGAPDLRASRVVLDANAFRAIVRGGSLVSGGMPQFEELSDAEVEAMRHYIRRQAIQALPTEADDAGGTP